MVAAETAHTHAMNLNCLNGEIPVLQKEKTKLTHAVKASVKSQIYSDTLEEQKKHL